MWNEVARSTPFGDAPTHGACMVRMVKGASLAITAALLVVSCRRDSAPAPAGRDAGVPAEVRTADGRIVGPALGAGWTWAANRKAEGGIAMQELKWQRATANGSVVLYAKEYTAESETLESLKRRDWRATYGATFKAIRTLETRSAVLRNELALEVTVEGDDPNGRALMIHELYAPVRGRLLIVTDAGPTNELQGRAQEVAAWRGAVRFAVMR